MKVIDIFFNVNNNYVKYMAVTIASVVINLNKNYYPKFHILQNDITPESKAKIELLKQISDFSIEYIQVDPELVKFFPAFIDSNESNFRLLMAQIKPDLNKAIYLDADVVLTGDLSEFWELPLNEHPLIAVLDFLRDPKMIKLWKKNKLKITKYVNTGVFLANLKKWRDDNAQEQMRAIASQYFEYLRCADQDIFNLVFYNKIKNAGYEWNYMPQIMDLYPKNVDKPRLIHYSSQYKPWVYPTFEYANEFWKYAKQTPFYSELFKDVAKVNNQFEYDDARKRLKKYLFMTKLPFIRRHRHFVKIKKYRALINNAQWYKQIMEKLEAE